MNIIGNTAKDDGIVLGEREFKRVKNGLDEAQVASFINELIKERDKLAQSQAHITSLNRLAEMTVVEADRLATQVKTEASEQAKAESAAIIDKAKEQARQMAEKKLAEAVEIANEKANAITAKAEEEAARLLENEKNKIRNELRNLVNQQFDYMLEELENLKRQAAAVQADFGNKLAEPREEKGTVTMKIAEKRDAAAAEIAKESGTVVAEAIKKTLDEHLEPSQATAYTEKSPELSNLLQVEDQPESDKPQWEVEILPPFNISKIMEVVAYLDQLPEVANTEMIVPQIDMPSILVFLRKPMNFVDVLQTIPAVAYVEEVTTDKAATNGNPRKVRISFSENTTAPEKK
jgi:cell division septum initiation protein DivIVA